ncbi:hypothetical protein AA0116_g13195 [Alternaria tenuissima]|nr:hypothetical protein AA0116_g13195 [Alternaria tenuissima]
MSNGSRSRKAQFEWSDYTSVCLSLSPTKHSRVTAAIKKNSQTWRQRQTSNTRPRVYVRKTVGINGDLLKGRNIPREYETWSSLGKHPYILACEDFQYQENSHNLDEATFWSAYCEKGDLAQFIISGGSGRSTLSLSQVEQVAYQVSSALAFIHHGLLVTLDSRGSVQELDSCDHDVLIHRDIKPHNIFVSHLDLTDRVHGKIHVKLGDFGCAKWLDNDTTMSDTGTVRYKAPETRCTTPSGDFQRPSASVKSDMWSFGVTMGDITSDMPEFCDQCCNDDPKKRASSVGLLEYLQQRMRPERNVSSFVAEALKKDAESTFWDCDRIEKILQAGANTDFPDLKATLLEELIPNASNKSATDTDTILQLLSDHGVTIDSRITDTFLRVTNTTIEMDMRSSIGMEHGLAVLSGVSALTQLVSRSSSSVIIAVAFPRTIRHIGHKVDELVLDLLMITETVDRFLKWRRDPSRLTAHVIQLMDQCLEDTSTLLSLLRTHCSGPKKIMSKEFSLLWTNPRVDKVKDDSSWDRTSISLIISYFAKITTDQKTTLSTIDMEQELEESEKHSRSIIPLVHPIQAEFDMYLARAQNFQRGYELRGQVSVSETTIQASI